MKSLLLVLVVLVLLSCVPPVKSGPNMYIRRIFSTCWRTKGVCKKSCGKREEYHIFCDSAFLCCIDKKYLPIQVGK
ncbi:beta-defensin 135 [Halichoerus grypus]|uniref:beta-defensin 135 n=1 Tax=Phoca vitulina TaxID=9720 RepID=UPI0013964FB6|nr:beta-defensin 135 [Phoca vitulina]XP_035948344.1 beta-defensin 135 [Halichoerus grypus]